MHCRRSISLREKVGRGGIAGSPPADKASHWTIHQQANQTDLEHTGTATQTRGVEATACAAADWPDLSYSHSTLIRTPQYERDSY